MYILLWKLLVSTLPLHLYLDNSVNGMQSYVALFQTHIHGSPSATSNVWIAYNKDIPRSKEFTVCHWIKIKFYNADKAACLWSYCTIENEGQKMKCLQACMIGNIDTAFRDLELLGEINLKKYDDAKNLTRKLNHYHHRAWTHLCWSFSSITGISKYY